MKAEQVVERIKQEGKYEEALRVYREVRDKYLNVDWEGLGFEDLVEDGRVDRQMQERIWLGLRDVLGWVIPGMVYEQVLEILEEEEDH